MMTICAYALLKWAVLVAARGTPIGEALGRLLVLAPAVWLGRFCADICSSRSR